MVPIHQIFGVEHASQPPLENLVSRLQHVSYTPSRRDSSKSLKHCTISPWGSGFRDRLVSPEEPRLFPLALPAGALSAAEGFLRLRALQPQPRTQKSRTSSRGFRRRLPPVHATNGQLKMIDANPKNPSQKSGTVASDLHETSSRNSGFTV